MTERERAPGGEKLRVLVVDDSPVARAVLRSILESDPSIQVVGLARNGWEAVQMTARLRPDVITMDVRMPEMDGAEATEQIMAYYPTPILVVTASLAKEDVDFSFRMLEAGALDIFEKPAGDDPVALRACAQALLERVHLLSRVRVITHLRGRRRKKTASKEIPLAPISIHSPSRLVVIGASTGGPKALQRVLSRLPAPFPAPIVVVQHIANGFIQGMCDWLAGEVRLPIAVARDGEELVPGRVYVAPENRHILLEPERIHLSDRPRTVLIPSVDVTMQDAARVFGARAIGVLLTGMGNDGAQGLLAIRKAGGRTIVQDRKSCTIFGMPRAAIELGAAEKVLPLEEIAGVLVEAVCESVVSST
ncbi:MAG: chemotaxis-specific protein-glutamate methyltransferase CheB [Chloroflexia bacterium]